MTYGERLRWARKEAGLTQRQLEEVSGVKQATISKIERGDQSESAYDSILAHHLEVGAYWLTTGVGYPFTEAKNSEEISLLKAYRHGQPEDRSYFSTIALRVLKDCAHPEPSMFQPIKTA